MLASTLKYSIYVVQKDRNYILKEISTLLLFCTLIHIHFTCLQLKQDQGMKGGCEVRLSHWSTCNRAGTFSSKQSFFWGRWCQFSLWNYCVWNSDYVTFESWPTGLDWLGKIAWKDHEVRAHMLRRLYYINTRIVNMLYAFYFKLLAKIAGVKKIIILRVKKYSAIHL